MRTRRPRVASPDEVRISRQGDSAVIEFADPKISTTHLRIGQRLQGMSDHEILDIFNENIRAQEQLAAEYEHVAVEIPPGKPQIEFQPLSGQWSPRGDVLRCVISDGGPDGEPVVYIDDEELSWSEFGRLVTTYAGWGMRIVFVPDDRTHEEPRIEVREPST